MWMGRRAETWVSQGQGEHLRHQEAQTSSRQPSSSSMIRRTPQEAAKMQMPRPHLLFDLSRPELGPRTAEEGEKKRGYSPTMLGGAHCQD